MLKLCRLLVVFMSCASVPSIAEDARILQATGKVLVDGVQLSGKVLKTGSMVDVSEPGSQLDFTLSDRSFHRFKGGVFKLEFNANQTSASIDLKDGELFSFLKPKSKQKLKIQTKSVAMGVRGTKFYVKATKDKSYLCVCEGVVDVRGSNGNSMTRATVKAGMDLESTLGATSLEVKKASEQMMTMSKDGFKDFGFPVE